MISRWIFFKISLFFLVVLFFFLFWQRRAREEFSSISIVRLEEEIFSCDTKEELQKVVEKRFELLSKIFSAKENESLESVLERIFQMVQDKEVLEIYRETKKKFNDLKDLEKEFGVAFGNLKKIFDIEKVAVATIVTGMGGEMYVDGECIIVGLDFFLGADSPLLPEYILEGKKIFYSKEYIVPQAMLMFGSKHVEFDCMDGSLLTEIFFYGRLMYLLKNVLPEVPERVLFCISEGDLARMEDSEHIIWDFLKKERLLFEKKKNKVEEIERLQKSLSLPEEVINWIGYRIVCSFAKNNSTKPVEIIKAKNMQEILSKSKYRPYV